MVTDLDERRTRRGGCEAGRDPLTKALGWASVGLGLPQIVSPGAVAKAIGVGDAARQRTASTVVGVRELATAAGLLARRDPSWLWARVGGDAIDLTLLGRALAKHDRKGFQRTVAATAAVVGITVVDLYAAVTRSGRPAVFELTGSTTVQKSAHDAYDFWRHLPNLPEFMAHLDSVRVTSDRTSHWQASAPFGKSVEWDAEITEDVPGERIGWRSTGHADVRNEGVVRFVPAPGDRGTEVHVRIRYELPAGKLGEVVARYFGEDPHQQIDDDLRRFKQVIETGQVVRSDGAPGGKRARREFPQRPAQPMSRDELAEETRA